VRLVALLLAGVVVWRLLRRGGGHERVTVGWPDGSSIDLDEGHPQRERLLATAASALSPCNVGIRGGGSRRR